MCVIETHITAEIADAEVGSVGYNMAVCYSNSRHTGGAIVYIVCGLKYEESSDDGLSGSYWAIWIRAFVKKRKKLW